MAPAESQQDLFLEELALKRKAPAKSLEKDTTQSS